MKFLKKFFYYFSALEVVLWLSSLILIITSFMFFDRHNYLNLTASLIGTTSLILLAKGNLWGQVLIIIFSIIYGIISFRSAYYGEVITYVCMTLPMSIVSLVTWIKNPTEKGKNEVKVNKISPKEIIFMFILDIIVTVIFYFILKTLNTSNLFTSTISVATSFAAVYLTARRSPYFALAYAVNDIVLIILWTLATINDISYLSVLICFVIFLINDIYGFYSWRKMQKRQNK